MTKTSEPRTWASMFAAQVAADVPAVALESGSWTSRDLLGLAAGAVDWLDSCGAVAGRPIPALLTTTAEAIALAVAGAASRHPLAPLNPRLTAGELAACIAPLDAPLIVAEPASADVAGKVAAATGRRVAVIGELAPSRRRLHLDPPDDAVAVVLHTSGTTGVPKAVAISQRKLALRTRRQGAVMQLRPGASYVSFSPLPHIAGLGSLFIALGLGAMAIPCPAFSTEVWRGLARMRPTHALLVPAMIETLLAEGALGQPSLEVLVYGSTVIRPATAAAALTALAGVELLNMYGQTEGSPISALDGNDHRLAVESRPELLMTVGRAVEGVELRIERADPGDPGEICVRAEHMFRTDPDGWLRTGDIGVIDPEGYLRLVGRKGDLIIRGGENVYPLEVEHVLADHPEVREAAVVGVPDDRLGQTIRAFLVPIDPAQPPDPSDLRSYARERLAGFKVPSSWEIVESLPRSPVGKVLRRELEARAASDRESDGRDRGAAWSTPSDGTRL
ncbi:MAG: long-chain fatty acid--CoA ligase [Acidobacteria bacterium]|nr:long-chain fatty acid--CoA ligase [Acidobacteriota bacterium]